MPLTTGLNFFLALAQRSLALLAVALNAEGKPHYLLLHSQGLF